MKCATPFLLIVSSVIHFGEWSAYEQSAKDFNIEGYYVSKGHDVSGKYYSGMASIRKVEEVYIVTWIVGSDSVQGVGMRHGDYLSIGWATPGKSGVIRGVTVYKINSKDKILNGSWATHPGNGAMLDEQLNFLKAMEVLPKPDDDTSLGIVSK